MLFTMEGIENDVTIGEGGGVVGTVAEIGTVGEESNSAVGGVDRVNRTLSEDEIGGGKLKKQQEK
uniref:Uncharacterized protein n=1 Tax=Nelumbo nucifera TaxID=4432 RepID=A0A822ZE11_NELNU|nr:TPA_asm: hypothetical protein HUJ06_014161 [Nelumbo nucifera]